jgi:hypothetical protein
MREVNELIIRGEAPELEKLVGRILVDARNLGWRREPTVEANLKQTNIGRLGVYCYSWQGGEGRPAASLLLYRTGPGELAVSNILPAVRKPLSVEEYNGILADFEQDVLRPLVDDLAVEINVIAPRHDRLEQSISPDAFRELIRFISEVNHREDLTIDDHIRWDRFWSQVYSDGSWVDNKDLSDWLMKRGLSEQQAFQLISRMYAGHSRMFAGQLIANHGGF